MEMDLLARWLVATRGATLIMTFLSATLAALFAHLAGGVDLVLYVLLALGLAHGSSNLFNDYWDYKLGVDEGNYFRTQYGPHPLISGLMSERQLLDWAAGRGFLARYCYRVVIEGVIGAIKATFERTIRSRKRHHQDMEVLCRLVLWNCMRMEVD